MPLPTRPSIGFLLTLAIAFLPLPIMGKSVVIAQTTQNSDGQPTEPEELLAICAENVQRPLRPLYQFEDQEGYQEQLLGYEASLTPCEAALEEYRALGNRRREAEILGLLSRASYNLMTELPWQVEERFEPTLDWLETALLIHQDVGDQPQVARTLYRLGLVHFLVQDLETGLDFLYQALEQYQQLGDSEWQVKTLRQLGRFHIALAKNQEAIAFFQQAITLSQQINDSSLEAASLHALAYQAYIPLQEFDQARDTFEQYLVVIQTAEGTLAQAEALQGLADLYRWQIASSNWYQSSDNSMIYEASFNYAQRALAIYQELNIIDLQAIALDQMAAALAPQRKNEEALALLLEGLDLVLEVEERDRQLELITALSWRNRHVFSILQPELALQFHQRRLQLFQMLGNTPSEVAVHYRYQAAYTLGQLGVLYLSAGQFRNALEFRQRAYEIYQELGDLKAQAAILMALGNMYMYEDDFEFNPNRQCLPPERYEQAIQFYQQATDRLRQLIDQTSDIDQQSRHYETLAYVFQEMGTGASERGCELDDSNQFYQDALANYRQAGNKTSEVELLLALGNQLFYGDRPEQALPFYQQALLTAREHNPQQAILLLQTFSFQYLEQGDYESAITFGQQQLELTRTVEGENPFSQANALEKLGQIYHGVALGRQWLDVVGDDANFKGMDVSQVIMGSVFAQSPLPESMMIELAQGPVSPEAMALYDQAIAIYQETLAIYQQVDDIYGQTRLLTAIGHAYVAIQEDELASSFFAQAFQPDIQPGNRTNEAQILENQAQQYLELGQYAEALAAYQQAYQIYEEIGWNHQLRSLLTGLGQAALGAGEEEAALDYFYQAVARGAEQPYSSEWIPHMIGGIYLSRGDISVAQDFFELYLQQVQEKGDRLNAFKSLYALGRNFYLRQGYAAPALELYQRALTLAYEIQDDPAFNSFDGVAIALEAIGDGLVAQAQPDLAIVFYKSAVNQYEGIREGFEASTLVDREGFEALFVAEHTAVYRKLADLLLQRDRILEAQQVLDLLKIQELEDYLRGVRGPEDQLTVLRPEQEILDQYNQLQIKAVELGQELAALSKRFEAGEGLTPEEEERFDQLLNLQEDLNNQFNSFVDRTDVKNWLELLSPALVQKVVPLESLAAQQNALTDLNAVLLYPLILEDRLELILTLPDPASPPLRRTVSVSKAEVNQAILDLRQALRNPRADAVMPAQRLYNYLIAPIEPDLADVAAINGGELPTIIYAPDSGLRYIPLAALHDGNQWLVQRFRSHTITAESLAELQRNPLSNPKVLAGAFADPGVVYTVDVGNSAYNFSGLPLAGEEVRNIAAALPNSTHLLDEDFSWNRLRRYIGSSNILHLATHAAFVPENPQESFILFGNGDRAILECLEGASQTQGYSCINNWQLSQIDLVVLSACETGLADLSILTDGEEVLGLGYQFQTRGAKAVMASLWKVSDGGTQTLMDAFYAALTNGYSKAEALQRAQQALITGDASVLEGSALGDSRAVTIELIDTRTGQPLTADGDLSHPYYWAPFILIGNGS